MILKGTPRRQGRTSREPLAAQILMRKLPNAKKDIKVIFPLGTASIIFEVWPIKVGSNRSAL